MYVVNNNPHYFSGSTLAKTNLEFKPMLFKLKTGQGFMYSQHIKNIKTYF